MVKHNVVTLRSTAASILHEFYERQKSDDSQTERLELIKAAAKLIKSDIKTISSSKMMYPTPEEISSEYANFQYLPESLRVALRIIFSEKNAEVKIASIGQAIIQAARPRILIAPLQIGLGVQLHHHFASKLLIDTLYSMGFCLSYSEIQKYESSAAVAQKSDISEFHPHQFIQYAADNVTTIFEHWMATTLSMVWE